MSNVGKILFGAFGLFLCYLLWLSIFPLVVMFLWNHYVCSWTSSASSMSFIDACVLCFFLSLLGFGSAATVTESA